MQLRLRIPVVVGLVCLLACVSQGQTTKDESETARATEAYTSEAYTLYLKYDFKNAIPLFEKALELQKKTPTLNKTHWRNLVDSLGESYGISGDLKKAKATFAYGIEKDPKYWLFHYDQACTYAELNDVDNAIVHIKLAYQYKDKSITTRAVDPWSDRSFQKLMNDDKFVNVLRALDIH
jgi:Tfp pilus assembly protein PilF